MKISVSQTISLNDFREGHFIIRKEFESNVIPHKGDFLVDSVWKDPYEYEVVEVQIDYSKDACYVTLSMITFDHNNKEDLKQWHDMVKLHGWETVGDVY